jgi:hypothetical protein
MKTKILTFILSLTVMLTFAQTSEHLSFKGVPIDGTLNEYVDNMKKSGFTHISYYYTTFDLENGSIHLSIENDGFSTSFVMLSYYDKINSEIIRQKALDDL